MSKKRKLFERILKGSKNIHFDDFVTLLAAFGFVMERSRGSHFIYSHPKVKALLSLQPNSSNQAKTYQIRQFLKIIEEYNLKMDED
jgi:predicted RNA binding protein YcfA (HicA-like mRNA interferase family)